MKMSTKQGSALLLILWAVVIVSAILVAVTRFVSQDLDETILLSKDTEARHLAETGLAYAQNPKVKKTSPLLKKEISPNERYEASIHSEGARLNLNFFAQKQDVETFRRVFQFWGLTPENAEALTDCILDWVDADDLTRLHGAERTEYEALGFPMFPFNRPFQSIAEVRLVAGIDMLHAAKPDWEDFVTLDSSGPLNLSEAPPELIAAVCRMDLSQAEAFVDQRRGQDGKDGTDDDILPKSLDEARQSLGLSTEQFREIGPLVSIDDPVIRIESTGIVGKRKLTITEVVRRGTGTLQILNRYEKISE